MEFIIGIYVRLVYAYRAIIKINRPKLGDLVTYNSKEYFLIQGVLDPWWDMVEAGKTGKEFILKQVMIRRVKLQPLWKRGWWSFMHTYQFYMKNWYRIDVGNKGRFIFS